MLKISSWFDSLPLKRKSKNRSVKKGTENADSDFVFVSKKQKMRSTPVNIAKISKPLHLNNQIKSDVISKGTITHSPKEQISCPAQETNFGSYHTLPLNRPQIRTNPWVSSVRPRQVPPLDLYSSIRRERSVEKPMDDSICSSGYGSHDSSPESSVHTPDWNKVFGESTKTDKETEVDEGLEEEDESDYCEIEYCPLLSDSNGNNRIGPPTFHPPPPPPIAPDSSYVLNELCSKMMSMRDTSERLKCAVAKAKEERVRRLKERQNWLEQVQFIKHFKWVVRKNFELVL